ncbi:MAG: sulfatase activating formylglycine-generating enzyme [Rhodothermales bacterium]|jgi:formylglycine-generating enzyme required for sulfatase activity
MPQLTRCTRAPFVPAVAVLCIALMTGCTASRDTAVGLGVGPDTGTTEFVRVPGTKASFTLVFVDGGQALIGTPLTVSSRGEDEPEPVAVGLSPYWIGQFEVTFDEYATFRYPDRDSDSTATGLPFDVDAVARPSPPYEDPSAGLSGPGSPATGMTQWGALHYARWLSEKTGSFYRLPTEAEWENACRLGGERPLAQYAWYRDNSAERLHGVGELAADALGLHDMLGNASEWTMDQYVADYAAVLREQAADPWVQPTELHPRTVRGGAFDDAEDALRCGDRTQSSLTWKRRDPQIPKSFWWNTDSPFLGFRLVRPAAQPSPQEAAEFWSLVLGD